MHAGAGGAAMQSVHAPGGARDVLFWSCGAHAFSFFFLPCTGGPRGHGGNGNACRPSLAACCVGHHAHRVHDDVKPASRLFVWWSTCNIADYDYLFDALLISWKWC
jgi:hypothetical protein